MKIVKLNKNKDKMIKNLIAKSDEKTITVIKKNNEEKRAINNGYLIKKNSLDKCELGKKYLIEKLACDGRIERRLYDLGFVRNVGVKILNKSIFGGVFLLEIMGGILALKRKEVEKILVRKYE